MADKKRVIILMSTYNGEKYLEEQLDSIFKQTYKNIQLLVRDDGSTDGTVAILEKYEKEGNLKLITGKNLGYHVSFRQLLDMAGEYDYYSFADQDDVWHKDKLKEAVKALNGMEQNKSALYFCDFDYHDKDMGFICHRDALKRAINFRNSLVSFPSLGFACVINNELRRKFLQVPAEYGFSHDYLALILATAFGDVYYDSRPFAKYRRHGANVSGDNINNFIKFQLWRMRNFFINDTVRFKEKWIALKEIYGNQLNLENVNILNDFAYEGYKLTKAIKKAFSPKLYRETLFDEFALRFMFLVGKL